MKKFFLLTAFIYLTCSSPPQINFSKLQYDFGEVKKDIKIKHIFTFTNQGQETLFISKVKAG